METQELFSTPERVRVLEEVLDNPEREIRVRRIAALTKTSPSNVSKYVKLLRRHGIVDEKVNLGASLARAIKMLINIERLGPVAKAAKKSFKWVKGMGVYGSWANGTNYGRSDLDVWVLCDKYPGEPAVAELNGLIRQSVKTETSLLVLTQEKLTDMRVKDPVMYYALINSFRLWGEGID